MKIGSARNSMMFNLTGLSFLAPLPSAIEIGSLGGGEQGYPLRSDLPSRRAWPEGRAGRKGEAMSRPPNVKSPVAKRSLIIGPRKTSITLEKPFWEALKEIAAAKSLTPGQLVTRIDQDRQHANLSSAIRMFVLAHYRRLAEEAAPAGVWPKWRG